MIKSKLFLSIFEITLAATTLYPIVCCSSRQKQYEYIHRNISELKLPSKKTSSQTNVETFVNTVKSFANNHIPTIYIDWDASMPCTMDFLMASAEIAHQDYLNTQITGTKPNEFDDIILMPWGYQYDYLTDTSGDLNFKYNAIFGGQGRKDIGYKNKDAYKDATGKVSFSKALKEGNTFLATSYNCFPDADPLQPDEKFASYNLDLALEKLINGYSQAMGIPKDDIKFDFVLSDPLYTVMFTYDEIGWDDVNKSNKNKSVDQLATILRHANSVSLVSDGGHSYSGGIGDALYTIAHNKQTDTNIQQVWNSFCTSDKITIKELLQTKPTGSDVPWNYLGSLFTTKYKNQNLKTRYVTKFCFIDNYDVNETLSFEKDSGQSIPHDSYTIDNVAPTFYQPLDFSEYPNYFGWDNLEVFKSFVERVLLFNNNYSENGDVYFLDSYIASNIEQYDINKPCLMLPLNGTLYDFDKNPIEANNYQMMVNYWLEKYPLDKYNYIVKGHPRKDQESTTRWCQHFFGDNWTKVILCYNSVNMEMLFSLDLLKNECFHTSGDDSLIYKGYQLLNPDSFTNPDSEPQLQFAGIAGFGTSTIYQSVPYLLRSHFGWDESSQYETKIYTDKTFLFPLTYSPIGLTPRGETDIEKMLSLVADNKLFYDPKSSETILIRDHLQDFFDENAATGRTRNEIINWKNWDTTKLWRSTEKMIHCQIMGNDKKLYNFTQNNYWALPWYPILKKS